MRVGPLNPCFSGHAKKIRLHHMRLLRHPSPFLGHCPIIIRLLRRYRVVPSPRDILVTKSGNGRRPEIRNRPVCELDNNGPARAFIDLLSPTLDVRILGFISLFFSEPFGIARKPEFAPVQIKLVITRK